MNIGQAAKASGLSERMIRYHEKQGLIPAPSRSDGGYRSYSEDDVRRMRTIALAQDVGFSSSVIAQLVGMMDQAKTDADVDAEALAVAELDRKTGALAELRGRIDVIMDRARSRLEDAEARRDVGVGSPTSHKIEIVTVSSAADARVGPRAVSVTRRERDLTPAD